MTHSTGEQIGDQTLFPPSPEVLAGARIKNYRSVYDQASRDPEAFWQTEARELEWFAPWHQVLEWQAPHARWFLGARCNIVHNCLDRHLTTWRRNKLALIWESESGQTRNYSYHELHREVSKFSNVLKDLGVVKGDRVTIYMPRIPEQIIAVLACARLGAIHSVVFGGFSVDALHERIVDAESKVVVTADAGLMNQKPVPLKQMVDDAVRRAPCVQAVMVVRSYGGAPSSEGGTLGVDPDYQVNMQPGRDSWYHDLASLPLNSRVCPCEPMDAEDPLFVLYTSGTTGRPKGIQHVHGGYMVGVYSTFKNVFDIRDEDRYWCTADAGWVTGHSYVCYGPFLNGATQVIYEGAPSFPYPDRWWKIVARYGVNILYTTPTAIRGLMRYGEAWPERHDLSSLRLLGSVGEPINPEAWRWFHRVIGGNRCPIMDTWWQTETGSIMIAPLPCVTLKPGTATRALPGIEVDVVDESGQPVPTGQDGILVIRKPWPSMLRTIYKNPDLYNSVYWTRVPGCYATGDSARKDEDGYIWIVGRLDDVIKVSGYRLGTAEIESALVSHPAVAEAACVGLPHEMKGNSIKAFVVLNEGLDGSEGLTEQLRLHVGEHLSKVARPDSVTYLDKLPKTRSGKIMRRLLKAQELGLPLGDISSLED